MPNRLILKTLLGSFGLLMPMIAQAGLTVEPFASVSSTKQIKTDKAGKNKTDRATTETEIIKEIR